jgi:hypothetical protein
MKHETYKGKDAATYYNERQTAVLALLEDIKNAVIADAETKIDWGSVGQMGHIHENLKDIAEFLNLK